MNNICNNNSTSVFVYIASGTLDNGFEIFEHFHLPEFLFWFWSFTSKYMICWDLSFQIQAFTTLHFPLIYPVSLSISVHLTVGLPQMSVVKVHRITVTLTFSMSLVTIAIWLPLQELDGLMHLTKFAHSLMGYVCTFWITHLVCYQWN